MGRYTVSIAIDGRLDVRVLADDFKEAKDKALMELMDADLRELDIIGYAAVNAENDEGDFIDY